MLWLLNVVMVHRKIVYPIDSKETLQLLTTIRRLSTTDEADSLAFSLIERRADKKQLKIWTINSSNF